MNVTAPPLALNDGSRVAVVGGGPAGSFFAYFLLDIADRVDIRLSIDIFEPRDFSAAGPAGCNGCGGIISESLVQSLAAEGINLPAEVVQRGIDSYVLHTTEGTVRIDTPLQEKRIAAIHRGAGPRDLGSNRWHSFDGYLQELTLKKGAEVIREKMEGVSIGDGFPEVSTKSGTKKYDLLVIATGINSSALKMVEGLGLSYRKPKTTRTHLREFSFGEETINSVLGDSMHVFLLNLPGLEFAALIPKGDYATLCLLGEDIDGPLIESFLSSPEVRRCLPGDWDPSSKSCSCSPSINTGAAVAPFGNRVVFVGDCGASRLYKDGIGAAYRSAKAAAVTAVFHGVSAEDFRRHYLPTCNLLENDNKVGKLIFFVTRMFQSQRFALRGLVGMIAREQDGKGKPRMSDVLWDTFTGSAHYKNVFRRTLHPFFLARLAGHTIGSLLRVTGRTASKGTSGV